MTDQPSPQNEFSSWQFALAVLGFMDKAALEAITDLPIVLENLTELAEATAVTILTQLEQNDLPRYRQLHERALAHLGERLTNGEKHLEPHFIAIFERLANRLLLDDPQALINLVTHTHQLPIRQPDSRQQLRYFEALALRKEERYEAALAVFDALLAEEVPAALQARALNSRAVCCFLIGRLEEAQAGYAASLALWQQLGDKKYEGTVRLNMGIIAYELQRYPQAQTHLAQAIEIFRELGATSWLAAAENELGLVYRDLGRWPEALAYFDDLIALRRAEEAADNVAIGLLNRGEVLLFQGRLDEAKTSLAEALELMPTAVFRVDIFLHLGLAHQAMGEWTAAYAAFENAMQVVEEIGRRDILPQVYYRLADWCIRQGEAEKGRVWLETAVAVIEDTREPMHDEGFKISLMGKWQQVYERLVLLCLEMGDTTVAFAWMERARARAFTELLLATDDAVEDVPISTLADVQAVLPNDTLLLCYFTTGVLAHDIPLLQAIPSSNRLREQLLTPARTILLAVRKDKAVLQDCRFDPNLFTTASRRGEEHLLFLDNRVLQQLQNTLLPSADLPTNLVVIPHGPLYRVPFAALLPEVELRFAPSATVLQRGEQTAEVLETSAVAHKRLLAVGYNGTLHGQTLQFTEAEVQTVAGLMGGQAWTGSETKKEQLRQTAESLQYLHIACHGWFNHEQPLESYVETGAGERLTAQEVRQNWRLQAELVTLSACQTGVSAVLRGDEPMGLIRAFLSAGARAVLVSQWPVADLPTFLLMQNFYGRLQAGTPISRALQQTQKWLRELTVAQATAVVRQVMPDEAVRTLALVELGQLGETAVPFAQPQFWAAFVVVNGR